MLRLRYTSQNQQQWHATTYMGYRD